MNELVGKMIKAVYLASDKKAIKFDIDGFPPIIARCDGDCCSSTWIENIELPENMIGTVVSAEDVAMPDLGDMKDRDVIRYYGFKIQTEKGYCLFDYRNESNGYYGGSLEWPSSEYFYGGVYGQNVSNEEWEKIA